MFLSYEKKKERKKLQLWGTGGLKWQREWLSRIVGHFVPTHLQDMSPQFSYTAVQLNHSPGTAHCAKQNNQTEQGSLFAPRDFTWADGPRCGGRWMSLLYRPADGGLCGGFRSSRTGWLPVRSRFLWQRFNRGCPLHAPRHGHRNCKCSFTCVSQETHFVGLCGDHQAITITITITSLLDVRWIQ